MLWSILPLLLCADTLAWKPAPVPLSTRWAKDVHPDQTLEYSTPVVPQAVAPAQQHLNGLWEIDVSRQGVHEAL